jgi:hypothetical protein
VDIDQSLGCLEGPETARLAAADMQLVSHFDDSRDPAPFVEVPLGSPHRAPGYWNAPGLERRIASARGARGSARTDAYLRLETALVRDAAPIAVYGTAVSPELFSERVGCRISQGALGIADLGALCLT